jgi:hypothetical protein
MNWLCALNVIGRLRVWPESPTSALKEHYWASSSGFSTKHGGEGAEQSLED